MARVRAWQVPALLSFGFRPFFLIAALWAAIAMGLWMLMLSGRARLPTHLDPIAWHAHELLFGYLGAVLAGFLLTAVPTWTGRRPLTGWPLAELSLFWALGRVALATSQNLPALVTAATDLLLPVALIGYLAREILVGRNWRNLIVLALLVVFASANALFHAEAAAGGPAAEGYGLRLGLAAAIMMIAVIGGRIIPSFTRNWLVKQDSTSLPPPPMQGFDKAAVLSLLAALVGWVLFPDRFATGSLLLLAGVLQGVRLMRWRGLATGREPLVWVLHAAFAFVPLGALALGAAILFAAPTLSAAAQHVWMAGAIGVMTLAVMTRAVLGHTGHPLTAGTGTTLIYLAMFASVALRLVADALPDFTLAFLAASALLWIAAFAGFAALYGPKMLRPRLVAPPT